MAPLNISDIGFLPPSLPGTLEEEEEEREREREREIHCRSTYTDRIQDEESCSDGHLLTRIRLRTGAKQDLKEHADLFTGLTSVEISPQENEISIQQKPVPKSEDITRSNTKDLWTEEVYHFWGRPEKD
ncbi:unnamed protein product [Nezara viridula]|uniref:Uncharacterized protein n=1 Tax=Nezara viridula TaxID=85310 RepID=A0A9P0EAS0_NEZVI|nr:unnamed protein product [Nezara viridula]